MTLHRFRNRLCLLITVSSTICGAVSAVAETRESSLELGPAAIDSRLIETIKYLAGDDLEGRGVKTDGINTAADYLVKEFEAMGLQTNLFDGGSAFQEFEMSDIANLGPSERNRFELILSASDQPTVIKFEEEFVPLAIGKSGTFEGEVAFVGYGISSDSPQYDDYADLDVEGKIVIMLRREPQQGQADSEFDGKRSSSHATFRRKIANAVEHGAAAVVIVNDAYSLASERERQQDRLVLNAKRLAKRYATFAELESPSESELLDFSKRANTLAARITESAAQLTDESFDQIVKFDHAGSRSFGDLPVCFATRASIEPVIMTALGKSLAEIEAKIDETLIPQSAVLDGVRAQGEVMIETKKLMVKNVLAVLEGEGPLAHETIVVGAHYDHLGMGGRGTLAPWTMEVHNGADDNASGTTALIEVARQLAARSEQPRRRIVFIAFTGEESGLLGSKHYVRSPRFPLDDTVAMINMDMVGRLNDNELTVYGTGSATEFDGLIDELNSEHEFEISKVPTGYGPSDHASFYGADVPVLFLFTGLHKDYHRPSDDWEKINIGGMRRVISLAVDIIDQIDSVDARPTYQKTARQRFGMNSNRAYLGIRPDMSGVESGLTVAEVVAEGPAEKAGMKTGDLILRIGDAEIENFRSLSQVLGDYKSGDKVKVVLERDGNEQTLEVTLGSP